MSLSPKTSTAEAGESGSRQLSVTVVPTSSANKNVVFSIDDAEGLSVNENGRIEWTEKTPAGKYTTTVTTEEGAITDTHTLTLNEPESSDD